MFLALFWSFFYHLLFKFGPFFLFVALIFGIVGLPIPDELLLTTSGYLVAHHKVNLTLTLIAALLGSICGITLSYLLGRLVGRWFIKKFGSAFNITDGHIQLVKRWFSRFGKWILLFGYFIPIFRHLCGFVAGASKLNYRSFAIYAYSGAIIWSLTFLTLGFYSHSGIEKLHNKYLEKRAQWKSH